jgi:aerotaxis receptor
MNIGFDSFVETKVPENELIISRTDLRGNITYANETFANISGYEVNELLGKPHNIVRHPNMPKSIFKDIWKSLGMDKKWEGAIKNLRKDGGYYWVWAEISAVKKDGKVVEYKSMRSPLKDEQKIFYERLYAKKMLTEENRVFISSYISQEALEVLKRYSKKHNLSLQDSLEALLLK